MIRMVKRATCMLLAALFVMACVNIADMKTANAEIIVVSPKAGDRVPVYDNQSTTVIIRVQPTQIYAYQNIYGQSVPVPYYLRLRVTVDGKKLYYTQFQYKSTGYIEVELPVTELGTYRLDFRNDYPTRDTTYTSGVLFTYSYAAEEDFLKAGPEVSVSFVAYHGAHTAGTDYTVDKQPTCTAAGSKSKHCTRCGEIVPGTEQKIDPIGHDWKKPAYTWSSDNKKVTATAVCKHDGNHTVTETVKTTAKTSGGKTVYTAAFTKGPFTKQTKTVSGQPAKPISYTAPDGSSYVLGTDGNATFKAGKKNASSAAVPDTVTYKGKKYKVTEIAAKAFYKNKKLTKVTIGKNVQTIGKSAFEGCAKLKNITIKTTKLTKAGIGKNSFKGIVKKAVIKCPKKKLEDYMKWMQKPGGAPKTATWKK